MTTRRIIVAICAFASLSLAQRDYSIRPVPSTAVHLNDIFWAPRIETNRTVSIPSAFEQCELTGRVNLFERAATVLRGEALADKRPPGYPFDETDLYKVIEGASYLTTWVDRGGRALIVADGAPAGLAARRLGPAFGVEMTSSLAEDHGIAEISFTRANGGLADMRLRTADPRPSASRPS